MSKKSMQKAKHSKLFSLTSYLRSKATSYAAKLTNRHEKRQAKLEGHVSHQKAHIHGENCSHDVDLEVIVGDEEMPVSNI